MFISDEFYGTGSHKIEKIEDALPKMVELFLTQCEKEKYFWPKDVPLNLTMLQAYYCFMEDGDCACGKLCKFHGFD